MHADDLDGLLAEWSAPADVGTAHGINRYVHRIWMQRPDLQQAFPDLDGHDGLRLVQWIFTYGRFEYPFPDDLLPPAPPELPPVAQRSESSPRYGTDGVNVLGYLRGELGLGEAARLVVHGLDVAGVPVLPVDAGVHDPIRNGTGYTTVPPTGTGFPVTLACANPEVLGRLRRDLRPEIRALVPTGATAAYVWWEVEECLPVEWYLEHLGWLAEVWVGSEHVRRCLEPFMTVPVITVGLPIAPEPPVILERSALGLPDGFVFLSAFDYESDLRRKNPLGVIQAFSAAFFPGSGVSLVLKCTSAAADPEAHRIVSAATASHPDIHLIERLVPDAVFNAMVASCDCYVSLHRAEGFGLPLANAMHHGSPVVATEYSGNLEYMTAENGFLVPARRGRVGASRLYPLDGVWAEPDLPSAIDALRTAAGDPAATMARGRRAAADIRRTNAPEVIGARMAARLAWLAAAPAPPSNLEAVEAMIAADPRPSTRFSGPRGGRLWQSLSGALRPWTQRQAAIDRALLAELAILQARACTDRNLIARSHALTHAAALAQLRREHRERTASAPATIPDERAPEGGNGSGRARQAHTPAAP